jgi:hypothetical protein
VIVAIHQPNYLPWLGYFHKMVVADVFVFLDHVQLPQGRSYVQRVQVAQAGRPTWLTVPARKAGCGLQRICDTEIDGQDWARRHLRTLQMAYGRPGGALADMLRPHLEAGHANLADLNEALVRALAEALELRPRFVRSRDLDLPDESSSEMLAALVRACGGDHYLHGRGGLRYQDEAAFVAAGVRLVDQAFRAPPYPQRGVDEHLPGLSVVDCVANVGADGAAALLREVPRPG